MARGRIGGLQVLNRSASIMIFRSGRKTQPEVWQAVRRNQVIWRRIIVHDLGAKERVDCERAFKSELVFL